MMLAKAPDPGWSDDRLIRFCLQGDERAWNVIVDKYKNLVFSIPRRYGIPADEVADVFQAAWLDAYNDLAKLRDRQAFKGWLVKLTTNKCFHWQKRLRQRGLREVETPEGHDAEETASLAPEVLAEVERDQQVREAVLELSDRCREMVRLLFFTSPPIPYKEVGERLGLATGSIGFIRGRCLERLRRNLETKGVT